MLLRFFPVIFCFFFIHKTIFRCQLVLDHIGFIYYFLVFFIYIYNYCYSHVNVSKMLLLLLLLHGRRWWWQNTTDNARVEMKPCTKLNDWSNLFKRQTGFFFSRRQPGGGGDNLSLLVTRHIPTTADGRVCWQLGRGASCCSTQFSH